MELHRAIILEKNVLFLAHNISSSELCTVGHARIVPFGLMGGEFSSVLVWDYLASARGHPSRISHPPWTSGTSRVPVCEFQ